MLRKLLLAGAASALPAAAHADWHVATSNHYEVYTEGSAQSARDIAARLEKFDYVERFLYNVKRPSSPIRVKVFMLRNDAAVQATLPFGGGGVAGFYNDVARGPYAVMTRSDTGQDDGLKAQQVLFHELTHHFMFQYFPAAYPTWFVEGFADFNGTMQIGDDDKVVVGQRMANRYLSFDGNDWLPINKLLTATSYGDVGGKVYLLYAEGWLLVHYLSTTDARSGQLDTYLKEINAGQSFEKAARDAFGDLNKLEHDLEDHAEAALKTDVFPFKKIDTGPITVRDCTPAENAMIMDDVTLFAGVPAANAGKFADQVTRDAGRFPDDPYALRLAIEADLLADRQADAAKLDAHWVALQPQSPSALMYQGKLQTLALKASKTTDVATWKAARQPLVQANHLAPDDHQILRAYYEAFRDEGVPPPPVAQQALRRALELSPQDDDLREEVAADYEMHGDIDAAITTIKPAAFVLDEDPTDPKKKAKLEADRKRYKIAGSSDGETPREMLDRLEKLKGRDPSEAAKTGT